MNRMYVVLWLLALGCLGCSELAAQQRDARSPAGESRAAGDQRRRDWLRAHLPKLISDRQDLSAVLARLDGMSGSEINDLASACLDELAARRQQQFARLRESNARERAFREELGRALAAHRGLPRPAPVGYFPIVAWLPEGMSMSAYGVVSPDGRSVRMSLMPFFSSVGPVHTFNFMTGETRRLPEFDPPSPGTLPPPNRDLRGR